MTVHYKFASSRDYATVTFDGGFITVADLKLAISAQKKLGLATLDGSGDMDLLITNATTGEGPFWAVSLRLRLAHEPDGRTGPRCALTRAHTCARCAFAWILAEYMDERFHIPKNTCVTIKRVPAATVIRMRYEQKKLSVRTPLERATPRARVPLGSLCQPRWMRCRTLRRFRSECHCPFSRPSLLFLRTGTCRELGGFVAGTCAAAKRQRRDRARACADGGRSGSALDTASALRPLPPLP